MAQPFAQHVSASGLVIVVHQGSGIILSAAEDARDLLIQAGRAGADMIGVCVENIAPEFFDLRTGIAGDVFQKLQNYRGRLAIIGDVSEYAEKSESFAALIRECNRGRDVWFVRSLEDLLAR